MSNGTSFDKSFFNFIHNKILREDLDDALLFATYLIDTAQQVAEEKYKEEFHRVIVLYIAAAVEALCLFLLEQYGVSKKKAEYKNITPVHIEGVVVKDGELVVAIKKKEPIDLKEIPFAESILLLCNAEKIDDTLKDKLNSLRQKRNSQHLYGRGKNRISQKDVVESIKTLLIFRQYIERNLK